MKRLVSICLAIIAVLCSSCPINVSATNEEEYNWHDVILSEPELNDMLEESTVETKATGLIIKYAIEIRKSGNDLIIAGSTYGSATVVKCGFKEVVIQRRADSTQEWVDYVTYEDLYDDRPSYLLSKGITVGTGYQYRVTAIHYAKKNIFSTQKINNTSNTVVFA